jgi:hypothetical protein
MSARLFLIRIVRSAMMLMISPSLS